ncbi:hypothetical protein [Rhodanobacter sp. C05]|uniref:hypothetical protein n=1 Tax=Rhodanobacter sp. C05 TaxID=1945855 RepID=UPI00117B2776|nr:hypothetical protein [Rhodanobacter sp. C05]
MTEPFVLKQRETLQHESEPSTNEYYDPERQLWIDAASGAPLIQSLRGRSNASEFGETLSTESREGADQSEISSLVGSQFGETTMTKTQEGHDQTGESALVSNFGETVVTATSEGADASEAASGSAHASYSHL